jgi:hypothetical protein
MVPILAAAAAVILMLGVLYGLSGHDVTTTAGAATGNSLWAIGGGVLVVAVVVLVALIWSRRRG